MTSLSLLAGRTVDVKRVIFCALVDCNHHTVTVLFEYSGSLAWSLLVESLCCVLEKDTLSAA